MNERIKRLRKELNLTMEKFGKKLGVKKNTISQWESGTNSLTDQMFKSICREFDVNEEWLRSGRGDMFNPSPSNELEKIIKKYGLSNRDYIFIEKLLKNTELLSHFEDFCLDYASALLEETGQTQTQDKMSIDEQVEDYRRQLELEEKAAEESEALQKNA